VGGKVRGFLVLRLNENRLSTRGLRHWRQWMTAAERKRVEGTSLCTQRHRMLEKLAAVSVRREKEAASKNAEAGSKCIGSRKKIGA
jgi:hypothetical protein